MASIPKLGNLPVDAQDEYDDRALDAILNDYNVDETARLAVTPFRTIYLPLLAKKHPRDKDIIAVRRQWVTEVAKSPRLPVFIVDDKDPSNVLYRVPPFIGTVHTGLTGHEDSLSQLDAAEQTYKDRMSQLGVRFRAQKFMSFNPYSSSNFKFQLDWITILFDFGYKEELKQLLGEGPYPPEIIEIMNKPQKNGFEQPPVAAFEHDGTALSVSLGSDEEYLDE